MRWIEGPGGRGAALFNGIDSRITVGDAPALQLGSSDFTLAAWIKCASTLEGPHGDLFSKFDPELRCGLNVWVSGGSACYSSFGDPRHIHAGMDDGFLGPWQDAGQPGNGNPLVTALTVWQGELYAGLADAATPEEACRVFRWDGGEGWVDCGRLGDNPEHLSVMSMLVHDGALYAGTGIWDWGGAEEANRTNPRQALTRVFRYEGGTTWRDLGPVGHGQRVMCLASYRGHLYAGMDHGGNGRCYRLEGDNWVDVGGFEYRDMVECLMPLGGELYGASHFALYRYDGDRGWEMLTCQPHDITQIHAFQVYGGQLWAGTWPQGYVLRGTGDSEWINTGRLGLATERAGVAQINEINALGVHNGKLYAGVLPKAQVFRYESDGHWTLLNSLASRADWDPTQTPLWMRVLTLTTHRGMLFACTGTCQARHQDLDADRTAGRVLYCQAGVVASHEQDVGDGWTHVAAVRRGREMQLWINSKLSHRSSAPAGTHFDLGNAYPFVIGRGPGSSFSGAISDVRLYSSALTADHIAELQTL